jgi:hypothetical protein
MWHQKRSLIAGLFVGGLFLFFATSKSEADYVGQSLLGVSIDQCSSTVMYEDHIPNLTWSSNGATWGCDSSNLPVANSLAQTTTQYSVECRRGDGLGGYFFAKACNTVTVIPNNCHVNHCSDTFSCVRSFGAAPTPGDIPWNQYTTDPADYHCSHTVTLPSNYCKFEPNCGTTEVDVVSCVAKRVCDGLPSPPLPAQRCIDMGVSCSPHLQAPCPGCPKRASGWTEVRP